MALIVLAIILIALLISKRDFCSLKLIRIQLLPKFYIYQNYPTVNYSSLTEYINDIINGDASFITNKIAQQIDNVDITCVKLMKVPQLSF